MKKIDAYSEKLKNLKTWDEYLLCESGLPGPRGNLELIYAVTAVGKEETFLRLLEFTPDRAPVNTPQEFLAACGTVGLGKLLGEGKTEYFAWLRRLAADPRWRIREGVAMALQIYGESHLVDLIERMEQWAEGNAYEKRAAAAALCEPRLLGKKNDAVKVLKLLDKITGSFRATKDRKDEGFLALKKGLAYCWSVAMVHAPAEGKLVFERWLDETDKDIRWIVKENLKKNRLQKMDAAWVADSLARIAGGTDGPDSRV